MSSEAVRTQQLASALRSGASRAAEVGTGGIAMVFVTGNGSPVDLRLRAASGFATADDAREAATTVLPQVRDGLLEDGPCEVPAIPALGERAGGGLWVLPLREQEVVHGALVVGAPDPFTPDMHEAALAVSESLSLRLDHDRLAGELDALHQQVETLPKRVEEEQSEEFLKLSEALFAQDIELLRSNEKLGKIERLKNDFIEKMSRELRTPLNSIIETVISVMTTENDALSEDSKAALRTALDEGTAFLRTLQNILDLWRIKQGELPVEVQDVNFRELVDEAIFSVQDSLGDKPLCIEPKLPETLPRFKTDLTKLSQVLFLLLDNAAKFTPSGEIEITGSLEEGERLVCSVRDTGVGICPDDQQFVFDEFFQVDEPSSQKYRGAGLGLTLVRDLVVLLEGEVTISSDVGRGTTVTVSIPIQLA